MSDEKPYYEIVLTTNYKESTLRTSRRESISREHHDSLRGSKIIFEERFLKLEATETWGGEYGLARGERNYAYWIPYESILYIKFVERKDIAEEAVKS